METFILIFVFALLCLVVWQLRGGTQEKGRLKTLINLAYAYSGLSVIAGPALVLLSSSHSAGWDCSDPAWGSTSISERDVLLRNAGQVMSSGAFIAIGLGLIVLILLAIEAKKRDKLKSIKMPVFLVAMMLIGYLLVIFVGSSLNCTIGVNV